MSIRKNFHFDEKVAKYLEEIAKEKGKTQTQVVQDAIENEYKKISIKKKLKALNELAGCATGLLSDVDLKQVRKERAIHRAK